MAAAASLGSRPRRPCGRAELAPDADLRLQPAEPPEGHVAGDDPDPRLEDVDLPAVAEALDRSGAGLVDGVGRQVGITGDEGEGGDEARIGEEVEVVEAVVGHAPGCSHGTLTRPGPHPVAPY